MLDGQVFDSKKEAKVYGELRILEKAGQITGLRRQVKFSLFAPGGEHVGIYTCDFVFIENGLRVVADVKSEYTRKLREWVRTKKLMLGCHDIAVREL